MIRDQNLNCSRWPKSLGLPRSTGMHSICILVVVNNPPIPEQDSKGKFVIPRPQKLTLPRGMPWKIVNKLTSRKSNKTVLNEIEYNGQKSDNQTDVAEM